MKSRICIILGLALIGLAGCDSRNEMPRSSGVDAPALSEPLFRVGMRPGPNDNFTEVGPVAIGRRGQLAIADLGTNEIVLFDSAGAFVRRFGGRGEGPSEFERISSLIFLESDSIVVHDGAPNRIAVFGPTGDIGRRATFSWDFMLVRSASVIGEDGDDFIVELEVANEPVPMENRNLSVSNFSSYLARVDREGHAADTLGIVAGLRLIRGQCQVRGMQVGCSVEAPFSRAGKFAAVGSEQYFVDFREGTIVRMGNDEGSASPIFEAQLAFRTAPGPDAWEEILQGSAREVRQELLSQVRDIPIEPVFWNSAYGSRHHIVLSTPDGVLEVFDTRSSDVARRSIPDGHELVAASGPYVVTLSRSSLDIPELHVFRIGA